MMTDQDGILFEKPGAKAISLRHLLLDFNGTLAFNGELLDPVAKMLTDLSQKMTITVITADTFGTAREKLKELPLEVTLAEGGWKKKDVASSRSGAGIVAIGNGMNDVEMFRYADIGIAVMGPEGLACELLKVATIVVTRIEDALGLLLNSKRLTATLRP
jgi:P-type E1-E2 ATPase